MAALVRPLQRACIRASPELAKALAPDRSRSCAGGFRRPPRTS